MWLVNTGWASGPYGVGSRIKLSYTRAMITAALEGKLDHVAYRRHPVFGIDVPLQCRGVPSEILSPRATWRDADAYDVQAKKLAAEFRSNFEKYMAFASPYIVAGGPV